MDSDGPGREKKPKVYVRGAMEEGRGGKGAVKNRG